MFSAVFYRLGTSALLLQAPFRKIHYYPERAFRAASVFRWFDLGSWVKIGYLKLPRPLSCAATRWSRWRLLQCRDEAS